jgi:3-oxoacyl-[acyl-carrier protein] reductase
MKNVVITGASRGIGAACTEIFSRHGARVFIIYRKSRKAAEDLAERTGGIPIRCDITDFTLLKKTMSHISEEYGGIDVLINNAGIARQKQIQDITEADWDNMFNVNVKAAFIASQTVLPSMLSQKSGVIINISSMWGISGASCEVHYSAAKSALIGMTKAMAKELGPSGIRVNAVAPGVIDTDMNSHLLSADIDILAAETPLCRIGTANEAARAVYFLASRSASFITGQVLSVDGGFL